MSYDMKNCSQGLVHFIQIFFYSISIYRNQKFGEQTKVGGTKIKKKKNCKKKRLKIDLSFV